MSKIQKRDGDGVCYMLPSTFGHGWKGSPAVPSPENGVEERMGGDCGRKTAAASCDRRYPVVARGPGGVVCTGLCFRVQVNVVGQFGEPLHLQHREQFSLLSHLCWFVKAQLQENMVVTWLHKLTVEHPYEWQVRIRVWSTGGYRDLLMGFAWDGRFIGSYPC